MNRFESEMFIFIFATRRPLKVPVFEARTLAQDYRRTILTPKLNPLKNQNIDFALKKSTLGWELGPENQKSGKFRISGIFRISGGYPADIRRGDF